MLRDVVGLYVGSVVGFTVSSEHLINKFESNELVLVNDEII